MSDVGYIGTLVDITISDVIQFTLKIVKTRRKRWEIKKNIRVP